MEYAWKEGVRFKSDPNVTGQLLETIRDRFGEVTPELVLKEARHKDSVIHSDFQWDDEKAATLYRLDTARGINAATGLNGGQDLWLRMNNNGSNQADPLLSLQSTGFTLTDTGSFVNGSNMKYIYYAHA